jgi:hypothetical protein
MNRMSIYVQISNDYLFLDIIVSFVFAISAKATGIDDKGS